MPVLRTPFGQALAGLLGRRCLSVRSFARAAGESEALVRLVMRGGSRPPLDRLGVWLTCAKAGIAEGDELCRLALVAHGADWLLERWRLVQGRQAAQRETAYDSLPR